jgi:hypothetical protein
MAKYYAVSQQSTVLDWTIRATEADALDAYIAGSCLATEAKCRPFSWWHSRKRDHRAELVSLDLTPSA